MKRLFILGLSGFLAIGIAASVKTSNNPHNGHQTSPSTITITVPKAITDTPYFLERSLVKLGESQMAFYKDFGSSIVTISEKFIAADYKSTRIAAQLTDSIGKSGKTNNHVAITQRLNSLFKSAIIDSTRITDDLTLALSQNQFDLPNIHIATFIQDNFRAIAQLGNIHKNSDQSPVIPTVVYKQPAQQQEEVLGTSISLPVTRTKSGSLTTVIEEDFLNNLILTNLVNAINAGWIAKPGNAESPSESAISPQNPTQIPGTTYYVPVPYTIVEPNDYTGGSSILAVQELSSQLFKTEDATITENLTVTGSTVLEGDIVITGSCTGCGGTLAIGANVNSSTAGSILFADASSNLAEDNSNLFWDDTANALGIGTNSIAASSILQLNSTTRGFLPPRMTTGERDAIVSPATGLIIYNSSTNALNIYNGTTWGSVGGGVDIGTTLASGTQGSVLFLGAGGALTQDNANLFFNDTNNWLGIGTSPARPLDVSGTATVGVKYTNSAGHALMGVDGAAASQAGYYIYKAGVEKAQIAVLGSSNDLTFSMAGSPQMTITSGGNVGIGSTAPTNKFEVIGSTFLLNGGGGSTDFKIQKTAGTDYGTVGFYTGSSRTYFISQYNDGTLRITRDTGSVNDLVLSGGNIGIGTATPGTGFAAADTGKVLHLQGNGSLGTELIIAGSDNSKEISMSFFPTGALSASNLQWILGRAYNANRFDIRTWSGSTEATRFSIDQDGKIGIGTTAPQANFEIQHTSLINPYDALGDSNEYPLLIHAKHNTNGSATGIGFAVSNTPNNAGGAILYKRTGGESKGEMQFYTKQSTLANADPVQAMVISDTGFVGIGTTSPHGKLEMGGNVSASAWGVNGIALQGSAATYTDTSSSGTVANVVANSIAQPTFAASSVTTYTNASTLYIANAPAAGSNVTITNGYALNVAAGKSIFGESIYVTGATPGTMAIRGATDTGTGFVWPGSNRIDFVSAGAFTKLRFDGNGANIAFAGGTSSSGLIFSNANTDASATIDTGVGRPANAAGVIEITNGTSGQWGSLKAGVRDAGTNTVTNGITIGHQSTGTPAAGLGSAILFNLNSSTTADQNAGQVAALWTDATHATRTSALTFSTVNSAAALSEAMRIQGDGSVGIGTTSANALLDVYGSFNVERSDASGGRISYNNAADVVVFNDAQANGSARFQGNSNQFLLSIAYNGEYVGIGEVGGAQTLEVNDDIRIGTGTTGCVEDNDGTAIAGTCSSDIRLKKNVQSLDPVLDLFVQLNPVTYNWRSDEFPDRFWGNQTETGLIAQEVEALFPGLVTMGDDGFKRVNFAALPFITIQAVKEEDQLIKELQSSVTSLQGSLSGNTNGPLVLKDHLYLSQDSVGQAKILAGQTSVRVTFSKPYQYQPITTATPTDFIDGAFRITDSNSAGFTIELKTNQPFDVTFNWHTFAGEEAKLTVSNGSTSNITLVIPQVAGASDVAPEPETSNNDSSSPVEEQTAGSQEEPSPETVEPEPQTPAPETNTSETPSPETAEPTTAE
jgi:hypothetical protein